MWDLRILRKNTSILISPTLKFSSKLIRRRRQEVGAHRKDILQIILDAGEGETALADVEIYEQIIEFIIGGSDTTSFSTFFALVMLLNHPSKLCKLVEELDNEFVDLPRNELPKNEILKNLPYLNAVINETLRLWPITLGELTSPNCHSIWFKRICLP